MKTYKPNEIKNIALVGSAGSGKTTLAEAMMYEVQQNALKRLRNYVKIWIRKRHTY